MMHVIALSKCATRILNTGKKVIKDELIENTDRDALKSNRRLTYLIIGF